MKYLCFILAVFLIPVNGAIAQSVTVGTISKTTACLGDTIWVPYSASGSFKADNFFAAQLSDANGSFASFTNTGHSLKIQDSIPVVITNPGDNYLVRIIATDPYTISQNTSPGILVSGFPTPIAVVHSRSSFLGYTAFVGEDIRLSDYATEPPGSTFFWLFDQDASSIWTTVISPTISYPSTGKKTGTLTVTNPAGCATSNAFVITVLSCMPQIPDTVHIVTGTESGKFAYVWVKAGASYTPTGGNNIITVFVEPGGSVQPQNFRTDGIYYLKNGASFAVDGNRGYALLLMTPGNALSFDPVRSGIDTIYCDDLQFDYSKVGGNEAVHTGEHPPEIQNSNTTLTVRSEGLPVSADIFNLLGNKIASVTDVGVLTLDLTSLANGVYFAVITAGDRRIMRKIAVIH